MQEHSPRIRRIALAIKSEDFSRRITPPTTPTPGVSGRTFDAEPPDPMVADGNTIIRLNEAAPTELQ